jgi:hypothetical protein
MKPQRFKNPCPHCTYHGQVEAGGVVADVFCCDADSPEGDDAFGTIILQWDGGDGYSQHDTITLAQGFPNDADESSPLLCIGGVEDVPLLRKL